MAYRVGARAECSGCGREFEKVDMDLCEDGYLCRGCSATTVLDPFNKEPTANPRRRRAGKVLTAAGSLVTAGAITTAYVSVLGGLALVATGAVVAVAGAVYWKIIGADKLQT